MRFKELLDRVDQEVKQQKVSSEILNAKNESRLVKQEEVAAYTNGVLQELSRLNPSVWYSVEDVVCQITAPTITLPKIFKRIHKLYIGTTMYHVGTIGDSSQYYLKNSKEICRRTSGFTKGEVITVEAEFIPQMIPVDSEAATLQVNVDCPDEFSELILYGILVRYAAKQGIETTWVGLYKILLTQFIAYSPAVDIVGSWKNKIDFGQNV